MNKAIITGRCVKDIELRQTTTGKSVAQFTLAVDKPKAKGQQKAEADFIDFVAWGTNAEFASKYFGKGSKMMVEGRISTRMYQDKTGQNRKAVEVVVDRFEFIDSKRPAAPADNGGFGSSDIGGNDFF